MIKAIETSYKGYRFRSRTEARFAVYLDFLGINWDYELEGFELPSGKRYLPDFYLPDIGLWIEIKPNENILTMEELSKILEFGVGCKIAMFFGIPSISDNKNSGIMYVITRSGYFIDRLIQTFEETNDERTSVDIIINEIRDYGFSRFSKCPISGEWTVILSIVTPEEYFELSNAVYKARSSRFEFKGE